MSSSPLYTEEARPARRRHAELPHEQLCAVVAGADRLPPCPSAIVAMSWGCTPALQPHHPTAPLRVARAVDRETRDPLRGVSIAYAVRATSWRRTSSMPRASRYSMAALRAITSAMFGVPASNLCGTSAHVEASSHGRDHVAAAHERVHLFEQSLHAPTAPRRPSGPASCAPKRQRNPRRSRTSNGRWGTLLSRVGRKRAPARCAISANSATGLIVPSTFDI